MTIRVFLLDDHEIVRRGLADLIGIEDDIEVVGEAGSTAEALARILAPRGRLWSARSGGPHLPRAKGSESDIGENEDARTAQALSDCLLERAILRLCKRLEWVLGQIMPPITKSARRRVS